MSVPTAIDIACMLCLKRERLFNLPVIISDTARIDDPRPKVVLQGSIKIIAASVRYNVRGSLNQVH
jgi:hypothetical protein